MAHLIIEKVNEVYLKIDTEPHVEHELRDRFTFEVEGAKFMPQYRKKALERRDSFVRYENKEDLCWFA